MTSTGSRSTAGASSATGGPSSLRALHRQRAAAALSIVSADVSSRLRRYLKSEDMSIAVNLFVSVLSVPAPPLAADMDEEPVFAQAGGVSTTGREALDETILLVIGRKPSSSGQGTGSAPTGGASGSGTGSGASKMQQVLSVALSSKHGLQPSLIPAAGSAAYAVPSAPPAAASTPATVPVPPRAASSAEAGTAPAAVPVALVASTAPSTAVEASPAIAAAVASQAVAYPASSGTASSASGVTMPTSDAPVLAAPAVSIQVHISLLTLADDVNAIMNALSAASSLQAAVAGEV